MYVVKSGSCYLAMNGTLTDVQRDAARFDSKETALEGRVLVSALMEDARPLRIVKLVPRS